MAQFAKDTDVPVERSRAEIERLIVRYGATSTAFMSAPDRSVVMFEAHGRRIMFELPKPRRDEKRFTHFTHSSGRSLPRTLETAIRFWEQGCRQAGAYWRW